jgi:hypothetical protein
LASDLKYCVHLHYYHTVSIGTTEYIVVNGHVVLSSDIFPLTRRPLAGFMMSSPKKPDAVLKQTYGEHWSHNCSTSFLPPQPSAESVMLLQAMGERIPEHLTLDMVAQSPYLTKIHPSHIFQTESFDCEKLYAQLYDTENKFHLAPVDRYHNVKLWKKLN